MASEISLQTWSFINQGVSTSVQEPISFLYDYRLIVNMQTNSTNDLFAVRTFKQEADGYNLNIAINAQKLFTMADASQIGIEPYNNTITTRGLDAGEERFGHRLLEILAIKIFGHGKARAAIANDSAFYVQSLFNALADSMNTALNADKSVIFGQYLYLDRIEDNASGADNYDDQQPTPFNFADLVFDFPVYLHGSMIDNAASAALKNGPRTVGGALVNDGSYTVPLSVKFNVTGAGDGGGGGGGSAVFSVPQSVSFTSATSTSLYAGGNLDYTFSISDVLGSTFTIDNAYAATSILYNGSEAVSVSLVDAEENGYIISNSAITLTRKSGSPNYVEVTITNFDTGNISLPAGSYNVQISFPLGVFARTNNTPISVNLP